VTPSEMEFDQATHLSLADVKVDSHMKSSLLEVRIKASKTDPFHQGFTIHLGAMYRALCPVEAMLGFLILRGDGPGTLFKWQSGKFLTRAVFVDKLCTALTAAGLPAEKYAGHSFRIGDSSMRVVGLPHQNSEEMGEFSLYTLHKNTPSYFTSSLRSAGVEDVVCTITGTVCYFCPNQHVLCIILRCILGDLLFGYA